MYHYIVEYWDTKDQEIRTQSGLVSAESYSNAVEVISSSYKEENIVSLKIYQVDSILEEEEINDIFEHELED